MRKSRLATIVAALGLCATAMPASAQSTVDVSLDNTTSARTLHVETMTGQSLSALDFGSVRSMAFRVRVVDSSFTRTPFSVSATMTNLYLDEGGLQYDTKIPSGSVSLGSQANPLNILGVSAAVQPVVDTVSTVSDETICNLLGVVTTLVNGVPTCSLNAADLVGNVQNLNVDVDLSALDNLPLLPQKNQEGPFTNPEFGTGTAGEGDIAGKTAAGSTAATPLGVISGAPVDTAKVLGLLDGLLVKTPLSTLVPTASVTAALQAQFPDTWGLLSPAQIDTIVAGTVGTPEGLTASKVLSQTGTYMSLPTLNVTVPGGVPAGSYKGTLVITALQ